MSNPLTVAETSVHTAQRRRVGRIVVMISGAALAITIWFAAATTIIPALKRADHVGTSVLRTETMPLTCLSPEQAADIIFPYMHARGSTYYLPTSGISAITVRGTPEELARSRNLIREFETDAAAACRNSAADRAVKGRGLQDQPGRAAPGNAAPVIAGDKVPTASKKQ